jgi:hypothetical protein
MAVISKAKRGGKIKKQIIVNERPQFRPGTLIAHALLLYNNDTEHNNSQTLRLALKQFIPQKYFDLAAKEISKLPHGAVTA